jgi:uncharacterized protein (TIGR03437 family)
VVVPWTGSFTAAGISQVVVNNNGSAASTQTTGQSASPAFFLYQGTNYAITSRNPDFALLGNPAAVPGITPARRGDVVILWGTGFGLTSPPSPEGRPTTTFAPPFTLPVITLNGTQVPLIGAGTSVGAAGLYQIAFQIPANIALGDVTVQASVGNVSSPAGIRLWVQ